MVGVKFELLVVDLLGKNKWLLFFVIFYMNYLNLLPYIINYFIGYALIEM